MVSLDRLLEERYAFMRLADWYHNGGPCPDMSQWYRDRRAEGFLFQASLRLKEIKWIAAGNEPHTSRERGF